MHLIRLTLYRDKIAPVLLLVILGIFIQSGSLRAQFKNNIYLMGGLTTIDIVGDNPGGQPILQRDTAKPDVAGGGFTGPQPGIGLALNVMLDKDETFRVPVGFDYYFYNSAQRVPITRFYTASFKHSISVSAVRLGLDYVFVRFPLADAKAYIGVEGRGTFLSSDKYDIVFDHTNDNSLDTTIVGNTKSNTFRIGGDLKLGIEGILFDPWYLNISGGIGIMNLFGRDDNRGELLTPNVPNEPKKESYVPTFHFSFLIQYKL